MSPRKKTLWACIARCKDGVEREVVALYEGDDCLLVSRPWCTPASPTLIMADVRRLYPLLAALISVAEYHFHEGFWYGGMAVDWSAITAVAGLNRNSVCTHLTDLMRSGYIHYDPADGRIKPTVIRVYPHNAKSGLRLLQVEPSWLPDFILEVVPRTLMFDVTPDKKNVEYGRVAPLKPMTNMGTAVTNARVVLITHNDPTVWDGAAQEQEIDVFASRFKDVPGWDYIYRQHCGVDFDLRIKKTLTSIQKYGKDESKPVDWRADGFSQSGIEVRIVKDAAELDYLVKPGDVGAAPSWEVVGDPAIEEDKFAASKNVGWSGAGDAEEAALAHPSNDVGAMAVSSVPSESTLPGGPFGNGCAIHPTGLDDASAGAGGARSAAPPPTRPPSASAQFNRRQAERQISENQLAALYAERGDRVGVAQRKRMTSSEISCIETYERLAGVPFCARDLAFLNKALSFTSHRLVLSAIRRAARWPKNNPGQYLHKNGMSPVWNLIQSDKNLHTKPKVSKRAAAKPGVSRSSSLAQKLNDRRAPDAFKSKPPVVSSTAPDVPSQAAVVSPDPAIVSEKVDPVSKGQTV